MKINPNYLQYIPVGTKCLVEITKLDRGVILPDNVEDPTPEIIVKALGHLVEYDQFGNQQSWLAVGNKIIPRPDCNIHCLSISGNKSLCLIDASAIIAIDLSPEISLAG